MAVLAAALAVLSSVGLPRPAAAQDPAGRNPETQQRAISDPLVISRLSGPVELDGFNDEPAWEAIEPLEMVIYTPTFGAPISEMTEVRIAYDEEYLYAAGRMYDSDPGGVRGNTFYRDRYSGDDVIALVIDSYNDYDTGLWFVTNPNGVRIDRTVRNDGEFISGDPMNVDWNSHWDVAVARDETGWFAEFRIPFSTLGFQSVDGEVTMGLIAYRYIARKNERQIYPPIPPDWALGFAKPSQSQRIVLDDVEARKPVYFTPYVLGSAERVPKLRTDADTGEQFWDAQNDTDAEIGADLKYSPSSNFALDLTVNTDFAQVETDDQQVNLTRFALFFPEKRQFFQERAAVFEFATGGTQNRLFHSRRIGLDPFGNPVRIWGGARIVGRIGGTDIGFLNMQTDERELVPSENMGVLRVRSRVFNPYSNIGGMLTTRLGTDGSYNVAYGLDGQVRPFGDEYVVVKWAQTFDDLVDSTSVIEDAFIQARWERRNATGLSYFADYRRAGRGYRPRLGFMNRFDFNFFAGQLQYKWFQSAQSSIRSMTLLGYSGNYWRISDGSAQSRAIEPEFIIDFKSDMLMNFALRGSYESVRDSFSIGDTFVPEGDYWFWEGEYKLTMPRGSLFRGDFAATAGSFYDGTRVGLALNPVWNTSKYLELGAGYEVNWIDFDDRESTTTHLARLRLLFALDTRLSLSTFLQYNSTIDVTSLNARFRWHFSEGTDLWVVWDEGLNTIRDIPIGPDLPTSSFRQFTVKYTHTFTF